MKFNVMLAQKTEPKRIDFAKNEYYVQPKLDGIRCYITSKGMFTRNHKPIVSCPHIFEELQSFFQRVGDNVILDGELYNHDLKDNFNKIVSLVRKTKPTPEALEESRELVEFHCYDMFNAWEPEMLFSERIDLICREISWSKEYVRVMSVFTEGVEHNYDVEKINKTNLELGYEGSMLREDAPYEQKRSWTLQKVKSFSDTEFTIDGFIEGKGKFSGGLGKFLGIDGDGRRIEVPYQKCTMVERKRIWENRDEYLGKIATFEYFERTPGGAYRFPSFKCVRDYE